MVSIAFGQEGVLAKNVVSKGVGQPSFPYDATIRTFGPGLPKPGR
ncbi:hypothetical protein FHT71_002939 [Rhizobium sp. BK060]|nr:hypothetical protein [Rhizobium sp. BK060]